MEVQYDDVSYRPGVVALASAVPISLDGKSLTLDRSYLLRDLAIERPDHVWCADITYIPVSRGFLYLVAVMDWASRYVLAWRLSNTLDVGFCTDALDEALARHGAPAIFRTDQGSQFSSMAFAARLQAAGGRISMDGRGRFVDNIFIERL